MNNQFNEGEIRIDWERFLNIFWNFRFMKSVFRITGINLGLIISVIILLEIIFGTWIFGPDYGVLNVPRNEVRYFDVSEFVEPGKVTTYTRDQYGFRGGYGGDPSKVDILVVGGSTTNERFLDDKESWVYQLQEHFRNSGKDIVIANGAVDGQSSRGHIVAFDLWFPNITALKPKFVLAYVGINDVSLSNDRDKFDEMKSPDFDRRLRQYFLNNSALYNQFRRIRGAFVANRIRLMHGANAYRTGTWLAIEEQVEVRQLERELTNRLDAYKRRLRVLAARIQKVGSVPIFITQPRGDFRRRDNQLELLVQNASAIRTEPLDNRTLVTMNLFNQATLSICQELNLSCVDLASYLNLGDADFYDQFHTLPSGSKKIASFLYEELKGVIINF